jgi:two-component sensor histidine kinase
MSLTSLLIGEDGFMPHGHCFLWEPGILWTTVSADFLIFCAYGVRATTAIDENLSVSPALSLDLYRIAQEALTNIGKHAHAPEVSVSLGQTKGQVALTVQDNGKGASSAALNKAKSHGVRGIRQRVARWSGTSGNYITGRCRYPLAHRGLAAECERLVKWPST